MKPIQPTSVELSTSKTRQANTAADGISGTHGICTKIIQCRLYVYMNYSDSNIALKCILQAVHWPAFLNVTLSILMTTVY